MLVITRPAGAQWRAVLGSFWARARFGADSDLPGQNGKADYNPAVLAGFFLAPAIGYALDDTLVATPLHNRAAAASLARANG